MLSLLSIVEKAEKIVTYKFGKEKTKLNYSKKYEKNGTSKSLNTKTSVKYFLKRVRKILMKVKKP